jgi:hypothetical protein
MATFSFTRADRYPAGATVKAYLRSNFPAVWDRTGAPVGTHTASATVAADGSVSFTGLADDTEYVAHSSVSGVETYLSFRTPASTATPLADGSTATTQAAGDNSTKVATTAYVETAGGLLVPKSLVDAKGDLLVATADNTVDRLAVGSNGQVLTADSAQAKGVKWATPSSSILLPRAAIGEYVAPGLVSLAGANLTNGLCYLVPLIVPASMSFDRLEVSVTGAATTGTVRLGLYADSNGDPGALIVDAGTTTPDISTTGAKISTITQTLAAGLYWAAVQPEFTGTAGFWVGSSILFPIGSGNPLPNKSCRTVSRTGALPGTITATGLAASAPVVGLRRSA